MAEPPELHVDIPALRRNYCYLIILVVDTATQLLRELFLHFLDQPTNTFFQDKRVQDVIRKLSKKRIIHSSERDNLLSPDVDVNKFDISLLHTLLTTFCPNILRPLSGWTINPDANDLSIGADLVRLRNFRNGVLAHRPDARISDEEYIQSWEEIKGVILRMARNELSDREQGFREQIDRIKTNLFIFYVYLDPLYMHSASASVRHLFAQIPTEKQKKQKTATTENKWILLELMRKVPPASPSSVLCTSMCKILSQDRQQETTSDESYSDSLGLYLKIKDILDVGSKQESKYTDDTWQPEINLKLKILIRYYGFVSCPSDIEGNPQNDSSGESSSGQLILSLEQRLEILEKWQQQETEYTEETREFILKSSLFLDKPKTVSFVGPSSAEGGLLKGTSDDPSSGPLTLTLEKRLQILQKWQEQETAYTDEIREFILKSGFSHDKPEKDYPSCPSDAEDTDSALVQQQDTDTDSALVQQQEQASSQSACQSVAAGLSDKTSFSSFDLYSSKEPWCCCNVCDKYILSKNIQSHSESTLHLTNVAAMKGIPLKGTSDDPSSGLLTLTLEKQLEIQKISSKLEPVCTKLPRAFILEPDFSRDIPEKDCLSRQWDPEDDSDDMESIKSRRSPDDKASNSMELTKAGTILADKEIDDSDDMESIKSRRSPDDKASDSVKLNKSGTILADKEIGRLLIWAKKRSSTIFPYEPDFKIPEYVESNVFRISNRNEVIGTAFFLNPFYEVEPLLLTAGHVIARCDEETVLANEGQFCYPVSPVGISSIADVGVLRFTLPLFPMSPSRRHMTIDLGTETSTHIYVVGCVSGDQIHQIEECFVLPSRDKDDGFIRFKSRLFSEGYFGSPCLVLKDGQYVVKGILIGREGGTDTSYELIAITFRCVWKRLGLP